MIMINNSKFTANRFSQKRVSLHLNTKEESITMITMLLRLQSRFSYWDREHSTHAINTIQIECSHDVKEDFENFFYLWVIFRWKQQITVSELNFTLKVCFLFLKLEQQHKFKTRKRIEMSLMQQFQMKRAFLTDGDEHTRNLCKILDEEVFQTNKINSKCSHRN